MIKVILIIILWYAIGMLGNFILSRACGNRLDMFYFIFVPIFGPMVLATGIIATLVALTYKLIIWTDLKIGIDWNATAVKRPKRALYNLKNGEDDG